MSKPVSYIIVGAGGRGSGYANYAAAHPNLAEVVGVAEPLDPARMRLVTDHDIDPNNVYTDWKQIAAREKFADAALITTQDAMHLEPAIALAKKGYHLLLEKPMAPTAEECRQNCASRQRKRGDAGSRPRDALHPLYPNFKKGFGCGKHWGNCVHSTFGTSRLFASSPLLCAG